MSRRQHDPNVCTLKACERRKDGPGPLVCPAHWALVPRPLKQALWAAMKLRSRAAKDLAIWEAADNILRHLDKMKVVLPPEVKLATPESEVETPSDKKIILP